MVDWANEQDGWVRQLVGEVLSSREVIDGEALAGVFKHFLAENKLTDQDPETIAWLTNSPEAGQAESELMLNSLSDIRSVNALAGAQTVQFNPHLTVLFGENGSGKSGYTRILKQLGGTRTAQPILSNVYEADGIGSPAATIAYTSEGSGRSLEWSGVPVPELARMAVFDDASVRVHLDGDLSYLYTPGDLVLFPRVAASINAVRSCLETQIAARSVAENRFAGRFTPGTRVSALLGELGAQTDALVLRELASVSDQEAAGLESLRAHIGALQAQTVPAQLTVEQLRRDNYKRLIAVAGKILAFDCDAYNQAILDAADAEERYEELAGKLLSGAAVQSTDAQAWKAFLLAGEAYRRHLASESYPGHGDVCLYCRRVLDEEALGLLRSYQEFANDAQRRRAVDARVRAAALSREALGIDRVRLTEELNHHGERWPPSAATMLGALEDQQDALAAAKHVQWTELKALALELTRECKARLQSTEKLIVDLGSRAEERLAALRVAQARYADLRDRIELGRCFAEVLTHIEEERWAARALELRTRFGSLQRSFTQTAKTAGEQFINGDFSKRFTEECIALSAPTVRLEFPGRQGRTARQKTVARKHKPSTVLSQGEQRLIALADFLAEAMMRPVAAPLVFDDPVSGLDRSHAGHLATRLAELSLTRQVIVFSHDIWFVGELIGRMASASDHYTYYNIVDEPEAGVVLQAGVPESNGSHALAPAAGWRR
ncbi:MAG TPA: hypothetical protein VGF15_07855 [Solirubrobacteraceae bacterium]